MNAPTIFDTALNYYIISLIRVQHTKIMMPILFVLDLKKKTKHCIGRGKNIYCY